MTTGSYIKVSRGSFSLTSGKHDGMGGPVVNIRFRAFTLIELLIVVAIIAILAAIAVPNFLEAQTRAKVARVTADMATMHTGIELYRLDNNKLPIRHDKWDDPAANVAYIADADTKMSDPANPAAKVGLRGITTPVSYLSSIPPDIFNTPVQGQLSMYPGTSTALDYWDDVQFLAFRQSINALKKPGKKGFALLSVGPDKYIGMNGSNALHKYPVEPLFLRNTMRNFYDPTNGTSSFGNVYRFSDTLQQKDVLNP